MAMALSFNVVKIWQHDLFVSFSLPLVQQPNVGQGRLIEVARSHTVTHHSRYDFSERGISPSQRPLSDNILKRQDIHTAGGIRARNPSNRSAADRKANRIG
jgi:hypothetical protein